MRLLVVAFSLGIHGCGADPAGALIGYVPDSQPHSPPAAPGPFGLWAGDRQTMMVWPDSTVTWRGEGPICGDVGYYVVNGSFRAIADSLPIAGTTSIYCNFEYEGAAKFSAKFDSGFTMITGSARAMMYADCGTPCDENVSWSISLTKVHDVSATSSRSDERTEGTVAR